MRKSLQIFHLIKKCLDAREIEIRETSTEIMQALSHLALVCAKSIIY